MAKKTYSVIKLEKHVTKDTHDSHTNGDLTVIWRDWDNIIKKTPKMVYVSSVNPWEIKGPHLHKNRTSYFSCIHGKVVFIIQGEDGIFEEIEVDSRDSILICVPNGIASAHINVGKEQARILVLADIAWKPNDNEMINVEFSDYDFNKWK